MTNSLVLIIDIFIIQHPCRITHSIYPMICGSIYMAFTVAYPHFGGVDHNGKNYIYSVLNWKENPLSAIKIATIAIMCLGFLHILLCFVQNVRIFFYDLMIKDDSREEKIDMDLKSVEIVTGIDNTSFSGENY